jgi:hypothetical protein
VTTGYNISCDGAGGLYNQRCYDSSGHQIVAYNSQGQPISYNQKTGQTYLTALNSSGTAYQPYGSAGIPYTIQGSGALSSLVGNWLPAGGADPQIFQRLLTMPGAAAHQKQATTTVPWYYPSFGLRKSPVVIDNDYVSSGLSFSSEDGGEEKGIFTRTFKGILEAIGLNSIDIPDTKRIALRTASVAVVGLVGYNMIMRRGD